MSVLRESNPPNLSELNARIFCSHARLVEVCLTMCELSQYWSDRARRWHEEHIEEGGQP